MYAAMTMALRNRLFVALAFVSFSLNHMIRNSGDILFATFGLQYNGTNTDTAYHHEQQQHVPINATLKSNYERMQMDEIVSKPRLGYVRPRGNEAELLGIFNKELSTPELLARLPNTPREIAEKYGLPHTPRDVKCDPNNPTIIGWIPSHPSFHNNTSTSSSYKYNIPGNEPFTHQGKIPRLIFQSWKSNAFNERLCNLILDWSIRNPEYDYFLFDDKAVDNFIRLEYGPEIFSSYACVKVGAAKCDVWRLLVIYSFGGVYFDADVKPLSSFKDWNWGEERDVVTAKSCTTAKRHLPIGCAHQWGLIYAPRHRVIYDAITETITNLAARTADNVYDISFWSYYHAWRNGPYNQSYMPGWIEEMGGRVRFQDDKAKDDMVSDNGHWQKAKQMWYDECLR